jgi:preprotein translocase subunit SecY
MWLGEQITERGIGNGTSLVITIGIVASIPGAIQQTVQMFKPVGGVQQYTIFHAIGLIFMLLLVVASVIAVTQAQRKIPVQYAKRVVGNKVYGGQSTYMPLRVNYSGVMPIIFGSAILMFPSKLLSYLPGEFFQRASAALQYGTACTWRCTPCSSCSSPTSGWPRSSTRSRSPMISRNMGATCQASGRASPRRSFWIAP